MSSNVPGNSEVHARPQPQIAMKWKALLNHDGVKAGLVLLLILNAIFFPAIWGDKTLIDSAWNAPSVMLSGAYHPGAAPSHFSPTPDPGAPAWTLEPWVKIIAEQYLKEHRPPLWNPYGAYGTPLAAAMQPQPFYPPTALLSLYPTSWTYNLFIVGRLFLAGLLTFLFARLFLNFTASMFAAIAFMLNGYFILFLDMPHLSVEVLLPGFFLTSELILRKTSWPTLAAAAAVIWLCVTGGMPELLFLAIAFGVLYFAYRVLSGAEFKGRRLQLSGKFLIGLLLGFGLSAFLLLPFLEFMGHAHDVHQAVNSPDAVSGLLADPDPRTIVTYLLPTSFGPSFLHSIFGGTWAAMRGYWGIIPAIFSLAAVLRLLAMRDSFLIPNSS